MSTYLVSLPVEGPNEAVELLGLGRITKDPKRLDLSEGQLKSVRAHGLVAQAVEGTKPAPRRKAQAHEED